METISKIITGSIVILALASTVAATPASAASYVPASLTQANAAQANGRADQCLYSRFGCPIVHR